VDLIYLLIKALAFVGLASDVIPPRHHRRAGS
jgi:hypothetical protein